MQLLPSVLFSLLSLSSLAAADTTSANPTTTAASTDPTPAISGAAPGAGEQGYEYVGCYNETTGLPGTSGTRALNGGSMISNETQTLSSCLTFCAGNKYQYCGIEYGRECWGSPYLSSLSKKLDESNCSIGCAGNNSQVCGGMLALTLYNVSEKSSSGGGSGGGSGGSGGGAGTTGAASKEVAGAIGAVVFAAVMGAAFSVF